MGTAGGSGGLREIHRHHLSVPGKPRILDEHYPDHPNGRATLQPKPRPQSQQERDFLALGDGAETWLISAAATGVPRIRTKMSRAVELAALLGGERVNEALRRAAQAGRFAEHDLASIISHVSSGQEPSTLAGAPVSGPRGTKAWEVVGR